LTWHLSQGSTTCLESLCKLLARSNSWIENYDCCCKPWPLRIYDKIRIWPYLGHFRRLNRINNAYKINFPGEYNVNVTFNVVNLTLFDTDFDSRSNPFEEIGDDVDQPINTSKNPLHVPNGPMIRSKTKALNALVLMVSTKSELKGPLEYQEEALVHLIHMQEGSNTTLFRPWGEDSKENKRILLQLGNNMGDYLFILFLGLMGCMEGRGEYFRFGPVLGQNK